MYHKVYTKSIADKKVRHLGGNYMKIAKKLQKKAIVINMLGDIKVFPIVKEDLDNLVCERLQKLKSQFDEDAFELAFELESEYKCLYDNTEQLFQTIQTRLNGLTLPGDELTNEEKFEMCVDHYATLVTIKEVMNSWVLETDIDLEKVAERCSDRIGQYIGAVQFFKKQSMKDLDLKQAKEWDIFEKHIKDFIDTCLCATGILYSGNCNGLVKAVDTQVNAKREEITEYVKYQIQLEELCEELTEGTGAEEVFQTHKTGKELEEYLMSEGFTLDRFNGSHKIYKNEEGEVRIIPHKKATQVLAPKTRKRILGMN